MRQLKINHKITTRDSEIITKYFQDIAKEELINIFEEIELVKKIKMGDQQALEKLIKANLRFVVSVAKQYQNQGVPLIDLINEGNIGLIIAAKKFDETRGFKFISYAVRWIRQSIQKAINEYSKTIRLPGNIINQIKTTNKNKNLLDQYFQEEPTKNNNNDDIDKFLNNEILSGNQITILPLEKNNNEGETNEPNLLEILPDEQYGNVEQLLHYVGLQQEIKNILKKLSPKEREVLILYFGLFNNQQYTLKEIAEKTELTQERVRQIKNTAIRKLKFYSKTKELKKYLG